MSKPSERIEEIRKGMVHKLGLTQKLDAACIIPAIVTFLDELHSEENFHHNMRIMEKLHSEEEKIGKCTNPKGNDLCTNGKESYHEYNMKYGSGCYHCGKKSSRNTGESEELSPDLISREEVLRVIEGMKKGMGTCLRYEPEICSKCVERGNHNAIIEDLKAKIESL